MSDRPTIIDVAQLAGVSKSTVSRVIQGQDTPVSAETRARVRQAIAALGYEHNAVASSLRTDRTCMMMLAIPDITNPFWPEVARGLQDAVERAGYSVVFANSDWEPEREEGFLRLARRNRFDAIAINPTRVTNAELLASGIPAVILGLRDDFPDFDMVGSDSQQGTLAALDHLYALGHRRIGVIHGQYQSRVASHARRDGYDAFLRRTQLPRDPSLVAEVPFDLAGGYRGCQTLLSLAERPTAIFAANDILAIGAMQAARDAGLCIPEDLTIIGMDDIYSAATTTPPLTTLAKDKYEIGRQAGQFLLERIQGSVPKLARRCAIPCRLVLRGSTAPPGK